MLWGDLGSLTKLRDLLARLGSQEQGTAALHSMQWAHGVAGTELTLEVVGPSSGDCIQHNQGGRIDSIRWPGSTDDFRRFSELVSSLIDARRSGHQYLESARNGGVTIIVSTGEYPDELGSDSRTKG